MHKGCYDGKRCQLWAPHGPHHPPREVEMKRLLLQDLRHCNMGHGMAASSHEMAKEGLAANGTASGRACDQGTAVKRWV